MRAGLVLGFFVVACGAPVERTETARGAAAAIDESFIVEWDRTTGAAPSVRIADRHEVIRIERPPRESRPPRSRRVDVSFHRAGLANALRFLSDRAGFSLVIDGAMDGEVTLDLRRVDPYDALVAIAEAHGAEVTTRDSMVIVRARR
jgi:hypothetical protein